MPVCAPVSWQCTDFGSGIALPGSLRPCQNRPDLLQGRRSRWRGARTSGTIRSSRRRRCPALSLASGMARPRSTSRLCRVMSRASPAVSKIATSPPSADRPGGVRWGTAAVAALLPLMHRRIDRSGKPVVDPDVLSANRENTHKHHSRGRPCCGGDGCAAGLLGQRASTAAQAASKPAPCPKRGHIFRSESPKATKP